MFTLDDHDPHEVGRKLGHDLFTHRAVFNLTFSVTSSGVPQAQGADAAVLEGMQQARAENRARKPTDRYTRKWLQLRLNAYRRQRVVDDAVTPELLQRIDVTHCPVTRTELTHSTRRLTDWSVDRLNNDGAYVPNNLAVMSAAANRAKGQLNFEQVLARAQAGDETAVQPGGLQRCEWLRLASLMLGPCFVSRPHLVPMIPLAADLPAYAVRPAVQQVQQVFTHGASSAAGKNALIKYFLPTSATEGSAWRLRAFADSLHQGSKRLEHRCDVWLQPAVFDAFTEWRAALDDDAWALAAEISRGLSGATRVSPSRLGAWHLATRGHALCAGQRGIRAT